MSAPRTMTALDAFTRAYLECALWSSLDESDESGGEPLDSNYSTDDLAPETLARMIEDCATFQRDNDLGEYWSSEQAGHDFWLTRNGHGAGFWDRKCSAEDRESHGAIARDGERLTEAAKTFGEVNLYIGDDGLIHGE